ncbi:cold-inducible protein YdjO-related protein [Paenibacillus aurantius]|uniref:Cold-inducible protein YdjO-related protein n=1 Tax=Paenibacillus aurantius TaxID=2918900 RepID=A0AA96LGZ8_9BACL|nr:cold-inducible protein YdjO-related protein [Paenibacillus aurantius]WNQ11900.1 cold-inducible protein YdjO-related protein [Paenibacillus aurantius]
MESATTATEPKQEIQQIQIWKCKDAECKAWIREEFVTESNPACPMCKGAMIRSYKHLPVVAKKGKKKFIVGRIRS